MQSSGVFSCNNLGKIPGHDFLVFEEIGHIEHSKLFHDLAQLSACPGWQAFLVAQDWGKSRTIWSYEQ